MIFRTTRGAISALIFLEFFWVFSIVAEGEYQLVQSSDLSLQPQRCTTFLFTPPEGGFRLGFSSEGFPKECNVTSDLSVTRNSFLQGQCVKYSPAPFSYCTSRVKAPEDICENWDAVKTPAIASEEGYIWMTPEAELACVTSPFFVGLNSLCSSTVAVTIQVMALNYTSMGDNCTSSNGDTTFSGSLTRVIVTLLVLCAGVGFVALAVFCYCICDCGPGAASQKTTNPDGDSIVEVFIHNAQPAQTAGYANAPGAAG